MHRVVVAVLLAAASTTAAARWIAAGQAETFAAYVDPATIQRTGVTVKMWQLYDYKAAQTSPDDQPYWSAKSRYEYDCKEKRTRLLQISSHARSMGRGKTIASGAAPSAWKPVPRDSILETLWEWACRK